MSSRESRSSSRESWARVLDMLIGWAVGQELQEAEFVPEFEPDKRSIAVAARAAIQARDLRLPGPDFVSVDQDGQIEFHRDFKGGERVLLLPVDGPPVKITRHDAKDVVRKVAGEARF